MTKTNKVAGFWIRFLARMIDYIIFISILAALGYAFLTKGSYNFGPTVSNDGKNTLIDYGSKYHFASNADYYSWLGTCLAVIITQFIIIPTLTNGRTMGMAICRIRTLVPKSKSTKWHVIWGHRLLAIFKRELFVGMVMAINLALMMIIFDASLFNKFSYFTKDRVNQFKSDYNITSSDIWGTTLASLRVALLTTFTSVLIIGQLLCGVSIIVRKQRKGLHDSFSRTTTVWEKRYVEVKAKTQDEDSTSFRPHLVKKQNIEWIK